MGNLNFLAKLLNKSYLICFLILFCLLGYLFFESYMAYTDSDIANLFYNIIFIVGILIYLAILSRLYNQIEIKIYKENYQQVITPLIIQAIVYGVITPFALVNYYVIYVLISHNNTDFIKGWVKKEDPYFISQILLKIGFVIYIVHMFIEYMNTLLGIFKQFLNQQYNLSFSFLFSFLMLVVWFILIRFAIKLLNEKKYIECAVLSIIVGVINNPFSLHGLCLVASGVFILIKDNNFDKVKEKAIALKDKYIKN